MMSMVSVVSQGQRTVLLTGIFAAAVVSMVSHVIDHASSGSSGRSPRALKAFSTAIYLSTRSEFCNSNAESSWGVKDFLVDL